MPSRQELEDTGRAVRAAMLVAAATVAHLVAGKALQAALFLGAASGTLALARLSQASGLFSLVFFFLVHRAMARRGPASLVPRIYGVSAGLLLAEWLLLLRDPVLGSILLYLHLNGFSLVLLSGFWSVVGERFDPRTARLHIGRIGAAATLGGLAGGLSSLGFAVQATRGGLPIAYMVPVLALVHGLCAWQVRHLHPSGARAEPEAPRPVTPADQDGPLAGVRRILVTPYLRDLGLLVLLVAVAEGLIDYVFKSRAQQLYAGDASRLGVFFGWFYSALAFLAFAAQRALSRLTLERLGQVWTVACLPLVLAGGGLAALLLPGLLITGGARGLGIVVRDSLYRSGYELLYLPVSTADKRTTRLLLDVGVVRLGDIVWGTLVLLVVALLGGAGYGGEWIFQGLLGLAVLIAATAITFVPRLRDGYVRAVETSLLARGGHLGPVRRAPITPYSTLLHTLGGLDPGLIPGLGVDGLEEPPTTAGEGPSSGGRVHLDQEPGLGRIADLHSRDLDRVRHALRSGEIDEALVPHVISLLARDEVAAEAIESLRQVAPRVTGQLVDRLLDPNTEVVLRRRLPRVLTAGMPLRSIEGLLAALGDERFEVRYRVGRALARLHDRHGDVAIPRERVLASVLTEVAVDHRLWEQVRQLDDLADDGDAAVVDPSLRERADRSLEHVFTLLSLTLPRELVMMAYRGLQTGDAQLRGTALEYLEMVLPEEVRVQLWSFLEEDPRRTVSGRSKAEILDSLLTLNDTIAERVRNGMKVDRPSAG